MGRDVAGHVRSSALTYGRYRLIRRLGGRAGAEVWYAVDERLGLRVLVRKLSQERRKQCGG